MGSGVEPKLGDRKVLTIAQLVTQATYDKIKDQVVAKQK